MPLYPLFADLDGREVLVVGGGEVATRKVEALLHAGARICVCAPQLGATLAQWQAQGRLEHRPQAFDPAWLDAVWLVVAATDDAAFNAHLAAEAGKRRRLANVVDDAMLSSFQVPAIIDRDPLLVAISSSGAAPMLARRLREQLETQLDPSWGKLARLFARHRDAIRARFPDLTERRRWYDALIDGPLPTLLRAGDEAAAEAAMAEALQSARTASGGGVAMVVCDGGADMLTMHALRVMNQADVLLADAGMDDAALALARKDAPRERFAELDASTRERIVAMCAQGQRVVVLVSKMPDRTAMEISALIKTHGAALELIVCSGYARFL